MLPKEWFHHVQGPLFGKISATLRDSDLTRHGAREPFGSRVVIYGRVSDSDDRPVSNTLIEIWQANGAGRYIDPIDLWGFPIDPNFTGAGRCMTDAQGNYRFVTIRPGAYPTFYRTGEKGWRASHIHFSLFGPGFESRLITQMYFEGDPLLRQDQMWLGIPDQRGRERLIARLDEQASTVDVENTTGAPLDEQGRLIAKGASLDPDAPPQWNTSALAYRFDIVLRGRGSIPFENRERHP
jgi:protocatechuate 3,4-dioxygenase beta subunit